MATRLKWTPFNEELIPAVQELCELALPHTPVRSSKFESLIASPHFDSEGVTVAMEGTQAVGFVSAIAPREFEGRGTDQTGYVTAVAVHPTKQGEQLGEELLQRAEQFLRGHARNEIVATAFPWHYFSPGVDLRYVYLIGLFRNAGYEDKGQTTDMEVELDGYSDPPWLDQVEGALSDQDYSVDHARPENFTAFLDFMKVNFPGKWYAGAKRHIESGINPDRAVLIVASSEVVGFVRWGMSQTNASIHSIGVRPDLRGRKIGSVLLANALRGMVSAGATRALFSYTSAIQFYESVGAQVTRRYQKFWKRLQIS